MKVFVKERKRIARAYMFFMESFVDSCVDSGILKVSQYTNVYWSNKRSRFFSVAESVFFIMKNKVPCLLPTKKKAVIVTAAGDTLLHDAFPYFFNSEIIPMLWDVWPGRQKGLYYYLKLFDCKLVFVTVRSFAEQIKKDLGIKAVWIPEGIDINNFSGGGNLEDRPYDILELGRHHKKFHKMLETLFLENKINGYARNEYYDNGNIKKLAFPKADDLIAEMPKYKVVISFPRIDTHPEQAKGVETLTQRYWEAMLCKCLMVGRAPQELIDLIGYNPVVNVDWERMDSQLLHILSDICSYQSLIDHNYEIALKLASWGLRVEKIKQVLKDEGYTI